MASRKPSWGHSPSILATPRIFPRTGLFVICPVELANGPELAEVPAEVICVQGVHRTLDPQPGKCGQRIMTHWLCRFALGWRF